jgi:hypothetical protein
VNATDIVASPEVQLDIVGASGETACDAYMVSTLFTKFEEDVVIVFEVG